MPLEFTFRQCHLQNNMELGLLHEIPVTVTFHYTAVGHVQV